MTDQLTSSHRSIDDAVFYHPVGRNLAWRDVRSLLGAMDGVELDEHHGVLKVTRNGHTLVLHCPARKNMAAIGVRQTSW